MISKYPLIISIVLGIIPTIIWLIYWLQHDKKNPEPKKIILMCFVFGMLVVPAVSFINFIVKKIVVGSSTLSIDILFYNAYFYAIFLIVIWAAVEEFFKYVAAYVGGFSTKEYNEPLDALVYMITAALGFAAMENIFYIYSTTLQESSYITLLVGNGRFIGATLLHVASSAIIGLFMAFSYGKIAEVRTSYTIIGFIFAITLHSMFNSFIIRQENYALMAYVIVWISIIGIILLIEKIKYLKNKI
ncbi:MAG TPA: PrsW family glutamic-type intramembrane protease [Candidatus Paceibacterota bacterium]|nr:PrsW family glutamic-type intramembrane protease [Candidatus Paceibacterota bacterium]